MTASIVEADLDQDRRDLGAVYTPNWLAEWLTQEVSQRFGFNPGTVLDPAAGEGALLEAAHERWPDASRIALDVNPLALEIISSSVTLKIESDAILSVWPERDRGSRLVLANPPWGAAMTPEYRKKLETGFKTARGQYDSYDVFLERIASELSCGDIAAVFLPDSFLLHQHTVTRELLAGSCTLHGVYRLGEGVFPSVNMGAMALVFSKGSAPTGHRVKYARLNAKDRATITDGSELYSKLGAVMQDLPQEDLVKPDHGSWVFDAKHNDVARTVRNISGPDAWKTWFVSGRGLEIGKNGDILICPACQFLRPFPRTPSLLECPNCQTPLSIHKNRLDLVRSAGIPPGNHWVPLAVGQDLHRHSLSPTRWIKSDVNGVDYKNELSSNRKPRLLVRKTGLGIHAAVEWKPTATTQTIYHFSPTEFAPDFAVAYAAGMLSSRVLMAWHISRSGDMEWRSHPYLTLSSIQSLPLPQPSPESARYKVAREIAENVKKSAEFSFLESSTDLRTEYLVAEMLGCGPELVDWAFETLSTATGSTYLAGLVNVSHGLNSTKNGSR